ncbi:hypothetical protein PFISCL1PPCAC_5729 [Pristionchus fissidentatus]|uniref:BLOC-1-related complex subunit 5 n=1 Tax=Pristionchus fissidentatus TaxID=1538716 RepID=A0AAV5V6M9_9BILA|nr:hypothetical protein PFISCL1PPCAC_5729 [Pristionchus fissidentatus]
MGNESSRSNGIGGKKGIVVVRDGTVIKVQDPSDDPDIKRLKEMPRFLPIIRTSIGRREVGEHRAISPRPFLQLSLRLSNHLSLCAKAVSTKQTHLSGMIKSIDGRLCEVTNEMTNRKKRLDKLCIALERVGEIHEELQKMNDTFGALLASLDDLNMVLPSETRLPPFIITPPLPPPSVTSSPSTSSPSPYPSSSSSSTPSHHPPLSRDSPRRLPPIEEVRVIDQPPSIAKR